jgi:hypothetical protein
MARLEQSARVVLLHVVGVIRPAADREWENARRKPSVQYVLIVMQLNLLDWNIREASVRFKFKFFFNLTRGLQIYITQTKDNFYLFT